MANLAENRKARFNFELLEEFEAGIELVGTEVKSLKKGQASLDGSYILVRGGEAFVANLHIPPFQEKNAPENYESRRLRRVLLTKTEIKKLADADSKNGLTIVPLAVYNKGVRLKLRLAIARGKKSFDKRESIKKRDVERDLRRGM
jgi:SsrA-binding protein